MDQLYWNCKNHYFLLQIKFNQTFLLVALLIPWIWRCLGCARTRRAQKSSASPLGRAGRAWRSANGPWPRTQCSAISAVRSCLRAPAPPQTAPGTPSSSAQSQSRWSGCLPRARPRGSPYPGTHDLRTCGSAPVKIKLKKCTMMSERNDN